MRRRVVTHLTLQEWLKTHWKIVVYGVLGVLALIIIIQLLYPSNRLVPFASIDGVEVGHWTKKDAIWQLDTSYKKIKQPIYFGDNKKPHTEVRLATLGVSVSNDARVNNYQYSWYWRLLPTSLLWYHALVDDTAPHYAVNVDKQKAFIDDLAGKNCHIDPVNATVKADGDKLVVVSAIPGGECDSTQVEKLVRDAKPRLTDIGSIRIPVVEKPVDITDSDATIVADAIMKRVDKGVGLEVGNQKIDISASTLYSWIIFSEKDKNIEYRVDAKKAEKFFSKNLAPLVQKPAGTTKIKTKDFTIISKAEGVRGQTLDGSATANNLTQFLKTGEKPTVQVAVTSPSVVYDRSYSSSNTGLSALMAHYADNHSGTYGVAMYEIGGQGRNASYNGNHSFVTASTYKLFVAYSTIKRVDSGKWKWTDKNIANGRDRSTCFDDMIIKSDNACAEALLNALSRKTVTDDAQAIGLGSTTFTAYDTPHSTALDEARFLAQLATDQLAISKSGRSKMLSAMKTQNYRQGIPAGVPSMAVADKVGFLWGLLHDAAIVYSPKGTYVLVILTDNSSWSNIAELAKQIEKLR